MIDRLHERGIGVIMDWVPAHFPRDEFALGQFDGTALYEHADPRRGAHPDWGTLIFNYGRNEVRNFLVASALHWLSEYHVDGLRVDAVASMLYRDYCRSGGEWVPNEYGGREDLEAIGFLRELNEVTHGVEPGVLMVAEESTAWPAVSRPTVAGRPGLRLQVEHGVDARHARATSAWTRCTGRYHHDELTFSLVYAFSEQFVLPLSPRRGGARQGLAAVAHAGRRLAAPRQPARAATPTCGRTRARSCSSWAASSARSRSGTTSGASTGTCWSGAATTACST